MIDELLEAASTAMDGDDEHRMGRCPEFIEDWIPKIVTKFENDKAEIEYLKRKLALAESELLDAEERIKELE